MASISWKTGVSGDWSVATDWTPSNVPGSGDAVTIATGGSYTITVSVPEASGSLNFASSGAVLQINSNLNVTGGFTATQGVVSIASGQMLSLTGAVSLGVLNNNGPSIDGPGGLTTTAATTLVTQTNSYPDLYLGDGATWTNSGTVTDGGVIDFGVKSNDTASFVNQAGGVFNLIDDIAAINAYTSGDTATFTNAGTLEKTGGTGISTIAATVNSTGTIAATVNSTGLVKSTSGTLRLSGSVSNTGMIEGASGGSVDVAGSLAGSGTLVVDAGGEIEVNGAASESVAFTGAGTLQLDTPSGFTGTINGFNPGAMIVLGGAAITALGMNGSLLHVTTTSGSYDLAIAGLQNTGQITRSGNTLIGGSSLVNAVPYLSVSNVVTPAEAVDGEPIALSWTDTNNGGAAAAGPWTDQVYSVSDPAGDNPQLVGSVTFSGTLAPGQSAIQSLTMTEPATATGSQYFLVKTDALNQVANDAASTSRQTVSSAIGFISTTVTTPVMSIGQITPNSGSDLGDVTVTVSGANFKANDIVAVIGPAGQRFDATQVLYVNGGMLWATFNLTGVPVGTYHVEVSNGSATVTSPGAFQVNSSPAGQLSVNLVLPQTATAGTTATGTVTYTNTGATDIAAPILDVSSTQAAVEALTGVIGSSSDVSIQFLATSASGPAGTLAPGASGTYSFSFAPTRPTVQGDVTISVAQAQSGSSIDWASYESTLKPPTVDATDWNNVYTQFEALVGNTTDSLTTALDQAASELAQVGQPASDVATLLQYELFLASGSLAGTTLDTATDISRTSSSLSV